MVEDFQQTTCLPPVQQARDVAPRRMARTIPELQVHRSASRVGRRGDSYQPAETRITIWLLRGDRGRRQSGGNCPFFERKSSSLAAFTAEVLGCEEPDIPNREGERGLCGKRMKDKL